MTHTVIFDMVAIGGKFTEVLTTCNEMATRIVPMVHQDKLVNARRAGGKLIFMAEWEPVFIEEYEDQHEFDQALTGLTQGRKTRPLNHQ